jgi:hypothetical protein
MSRKNYLDFAVLVKDELEKARRKHPGTQHSLHEGYAVILEEVDEFWDIVKSQNPDTIHALEELVQIAAMCQRTAEDLLLVKNKQCTKCLVRLSERRNKYCGDGTDKDNSHNWVKIELPVIGSIQHSNMVMASDDFELPAQFTINSQLDGHYRCDAKNIPGLGPYLTWISDKLIEVNGQQYTLKHSPAYSVPLGDYVFTASLV